MIIEQKYLIPETLSEASEFADEHIGAFKYIAGGTDVMINKFQDNETSPCLIDLSKIKELKGVAKRENYLRIGAMESLEDLQYKKEIKEEFPALIEAALSVGSPLIRKTATIGGNILCENRCLYFNQSNWWRDSIGFCLKCDGDTCIATGGKKACFSELVSDTAPALIAMDARIELHEKGSNTIIKLEDIYTGDGVKPRNLSDTSIIVSILLPLDRRFNVSFFKLRERQSLDFTSLTSAVCADRDGKLKIALAGVDPKAVVVEGSVNDNKDDLLKKALKGCRSVDNDMYSRNYRREMITVFLNRSFKKLGI